VVVMAHFCVWPFVNDFADGFFMGE
jgi:hypothetical protein